METPTSPALQEIDAAVLTPIVRQALGREGLQLQEWRASPLGGGAGNPTSLGVYRFEGAGRDQEEVLPWSVVLKVIQSPANVGQENLGGGENQAHWNYWKRELLLNQSGVLDTLPEGTAAPRCFGAVERPGQVAWLWLEDIHDTYPGAWPLARYALAARHLGRLNGSFISARLLPAFPWFNQHGIRQWVAETLDWKAFPWDHPLALRRYPRPEANSFRRLLLENERFFAGLDRLPKTLSHGDTYPTNLKARDGEGQAKTVFLDWGLAGIAPLGDDLGQLAFGTEMSLPEAGREAVQVALFDGYLAGLNDSGCSYDPPWVKFGFTASAALRVGLWHLFLLGLDIQQNEVIPETNVESPSGDDCLEVAMANQAYRLLDALE